MAAISATSRVLPATNVLPSSAIAITISSTSIARCRRTRLKTTWVTTSQPTKKPASDIQSMCGVNSGRTARFSWRRPGSGTNGQSRSINHSTRIDIATNAERLRGVPCGETRLPSAWKTVPRTVPSSDPVAFSDRSRRLDTRIATEACSSSSPSDSNAPSSTPATMPVTRPQRGSNSSATQKPNGTYSSTLLNMSPRPARAQPSERSASTSVGPSATKRNGYSET